MRDGTYAELDKEISIERINPFLNGKGFSERNSSKGRELRICSKLCAKPFRRE